jgi:hypothetical protein
LLLPEMRCRCLRFQLPESSPRPPHCRRRPEIELFKSLKIKKNLLSLLHFTITPFSKSAIDKCNFHFHFYQLNFNKYTCQLLKSVSYFNLQMGFFSLSAINQSKILQTGTC